MPQHEDPLVWNALANAWQNASTPGPSGEPIGLAVGTPTASQVRLAPSIGQTVQVDGTFTGVIEASVSLPSGAATEQFPSYSASVVFNAGAANEQVGHLSVSGLASSSAQATLSTSESADGTIHGSVRVGTIAPSVSGGVTTYIFTSMHQTWPHSQYFQLASGFGLFATNQQPGSTGTVEVWTFMVGLTNNFSASGGAADWDPQYHYSPLAGGKVFFKGLIVTPGTTTVSGVTFFTLPANYRPSKTCRWPCINRDANTIGYCSLHSDGSMQIFNFTGHSENIDISGTAHIA